MSIDAQQALAILLVLFPSVDIHGLQEIASSILTAKTKPFREGEELAE